MTSPGETVIDFKRRLIDTHDSVKALLPPQQGPNRPQLVTRGGRTLCTIPGFTFVAGNVVVLTVDARGRFSVAINDTFLTLPAAAADLAVCNPFRFAVTLAKEGQAVKIGTGRLTEDERVLVPDQ